MIDAAVIILQMLSLPGLLARKLSISKVNDSDNSSLSTTCYTVLTVSYAGNNYAGCNSEAITKRSRISLEAIFAITGAILINKNMK